MAERLCRVAHRMIYTGAIMWSRESELVNGSQLQCGHTTSVGGAHDCSGEFTLSAIDAPLDISDKSGDGNCHAP